MSLKKESFMKKAFCLLLAILLAAPLWTLPGTAAVKSRSLRRRPTGTYWRRVT